MKTPAKYCSALLLLICLLGTGRGFAVTFETIQSTYLGDGWFQYDVKTFYDPFFLDSRLVEFGIIITNGVDIEYGANPTNWDSDSTNFAYWYYSDSAPQSRVGEQVFLMHSSATSYRLGTNAASVWSLVTSDVYPNGIVSENLVGYGIVPCLLPCPPEQADNSPTNYLTTIELIPDIVIKQLLTGPAQYGLVFDWNSDSTDLLQASPDLQNWTNVTYIFGTAGETLWLTNQHLLDNGQYFRLLLAAGYQTTNVPPLSAGSSVRTSAIKKLSTAKSTPRVTSCRPKGGFVSVTIATEPGQSGEIQALNSVGTVIQTQRFKAEGNSVVVNFNTKKFNSVVFFKAMMN